MTNTRLKCEHPGCTSKRRFTRKYELQRHMKKHAPPVAYPRPVIGCAYQGARSFYRSDKLKVHLRMSHTEEALCKCPVQGFPSVQLPLDLIYYHADFHHQGDHKTIPVLSQYQKNGSKRVARCPIGNSNACGKWIATTQMPSHLLSHSEEDRLKFRTDTLQAGYDSITGQLTCSICLQPFSDPEEFARHIHLRHLLEPGSEGAEHVSKLYNILVKHLDRNRRLTRTDLWNFPSDVLRNEHLDCLFCGLVINESYPQSWLHYAHTDHIRDHMKIHKEDITEVIQHRRQILKHYPDFSKHPIFDDLRVTSTAPPAVGSL
ncbi:hypothetical protein SLS56_003621 [Neofusicoccum ribis]|uniref:C2H2-type domain-containing protein n=1 Tax=Neofusicoccum ribis TaxID=45134 RepID=A0ABR3SYF7_9PEZI